ncbi:alpha/beta hydrolase [Flavobacterium sp. Arc3]|uniref:alpha/beta hydrolase family protein n=1 Tax=Flavobacterium sp. Arc3 TaxID=3046686 RepID=UPI00352F2D5E
MKKKTLLFLILFINFINAQSSKEITFEESKKILNINSEEIFGTLTTLSLSKKYPVVLIIAGSGPTDRDGNNSMMKNNSLKMLSIELAKNGIASLRYDKRGVGESKNATKSEANLRFEDYITDVENWIDLLEKDKRFSKIVVIGHSEGSLIGMIASAKADKFISIAGAGNSADKIIKEQLSKQPKQVQDLTFPIIDSLKNGKLVENVPPMLSSLFRPSVQPYMISWFKYNPQTEIKKLSIPILIIQGNNDIQVTVADAENLSQANKKSELLVINKMNHIMKIIDGDNQSNLKSYNDETLPISVEMINKIGSFIKN